ncbi:unnamed protein product [Lupinus luteus]|uniref:Aminotransferase-like plant mobile domain-containing protein n=1 Tax=Lupinus luteus TaxID=3873 RepID=A0AAV1WH38_LUPLU
MASSSSSGSRILQFGTKYPSLLHMQEQHISQNIWKCDSDRNLKCRCAQQFHNGASNISTLVVQLLKESEFYWVAQLTVFQVNHILITALVERWRPETHMFHMPFGECTITL